MLDSVPLIVVPSRAETCFYKTTFDVETAVAGVNSAKYYCKNELPKTKFEAYTPVPRLVNNRLQPPFSSCLIIDSIGSSKTAF